MSADGHNHNAPQRVNGARYDVEQKQPQTGRPLIRSPWRALVQDFSPIWFTWCMNSGIIAILLHQHPYQFRGIKVLSNVAFVVDLTLFIIFSIIFLLRFAIFRAEAYNEITNDISQLCLSACWVIAYLTLPACVALMVSQVYWGGYWAMMLAYVMWWFGALWTVSTLFFVFSIFARRHLAGGPVADVAKHNTHTQPLPILVIIPAVAVATLAVIGSEIASYANHMNARLAVPVIITAFPLLGIAMALATFLCAILFRQLLETGFPPPAQITSMFVYIGPFGQSAAALQGLGNAAIVWFPSYNRGTFITEQSAQALSAACVLGSLLLLGTGAFFILFSIYAVIDRATTTKKVKWSPSWNAVIFPSATVTTATTFFATEMDSSAFRVITSIQLVAWVVMYFINLFFTLAGIWKGELLIVREDPRVKKQMEEQQKER